MTELKQNKDNPFPTEPVCFGIEKRRPVYFMHENDLFATYTIKNA